jgi:hypothetical protein
MSENRTIDDYWRDDKAFRLIVEKNFDFLMLLKHIQHGNISHNVAWKDGKILIGRVTAQVEGLQG